MGEIGRSYPAGTGSIEHLKAVADVTELKATPEASLKDRDEIFVESLTIKYFYDEQAVSGDEAPNDQTGGTGFWIKGVALASTHATSHQDGGSDEINVAALSGELADPQPVKAHDLAGSDHNSATLAELNAKVSDATLIDTADARLSDDRDPNAHDLAGADHNAATLAELNSKVSDATLIDTGDARLSDDRDPNAHDLAGSDHNSATLAQLNAKVSDATLIDTGDSRLSDDRDPNAHDLAGADHNSATLAQLNAKVSDATLIDTGDSRLSDERTPSNNSATNAKLADMAANTAKVRNVGSSGDPTDLAMPASTFLARLASGNIIAATVSQILTLLGLSSTSNVTFNNIQVDGQSHSPTNTLTPAASIETNCNDGNVHKAILDQDSTLGAPTNLKNGGTYIWEIFQDDTVGTFTLAFNAVFDFGDAGAPTISTGVDKMTMITGISDGTNIFVNSSKGHN